MGIKNDKKISAVILAAGSGTRMGGAVRKQRISILGESVVHRSVRAFAASEFISEIIVVARADETEILKNDLSDLEVPIQIVVGGTSRADSAKNGFLHISSDSEFVMIHDAARCLITPEMIDAVAIAVLEHGAATASTPLTDTLKRSRDGTNVDTTIPRRDLYVAQTPQAFSREIYQRALEASSKEKQEITDDNMMAELIGVSPYLVDTGKENIKITTPCDIDYAEYVIKKRENMSDFRIGHGYDVHMLVDGRPLIIGGVHIPYEKGLLGHSDADVLAHAIMDALLGAAALGDIGRHFPDTSDEYCGISSMILLEKVAGLICAAGYKVCNIDATLVLQRPKVAPFISDMVKNISDALGIPPSAVNVKATTEEHLGFTGSGEGAAAHAVASITK